MPTELPDFERDYQSYEELLSVLEQKPTGRLSSLVPDTIYEAIWGPRPPDPATIQKRRSDIQEQYEELQTLHSPTEIFPNELAPDSFKGSVLEAEYDSTPQDTYTEIKANSSTLGETKDRIDELWQVAERTEEYLDRTEALLLEDKRLFLRKDEQIELREIKEALREHGDNIENIATTCAEKIESARSEAQPAHRDVCEEYEQITSMVEITTFSGKPIGPSTDINGITFDPTYVSEWRDTSVRSIEAANAFIKKLQQDIETAESCIQQSNEVLSTYNFALTGSEQARLKMIDRVLSRYVSRINAYENAKLDFERQFADIKESLQSVKQAASPYTEYERYLTQSEKTRLLKQVKETNQEITQLKEEFDYTHLPSSDSERVQAKKRDIQSISDCLDGYNAEFVDRERKRYKHLFTDIDEENLSLTPTQQKAIIRNGTYNQVIAAAGTGKTLTLTTRVAYLIESQDVRPERILVMAFTREARDEMDSRLESNFGITDVQIETIHSFGNDLIQSSRDAGYGVIDDHQIENLIRRHLRAAKSGDNDRLAKYYFNLLVHFDDVYLDEADFETKEAYVEARKQQWYQTLRDEEVKSRAEKLIADFLFTHQVDYRYEDLAEWADTADDKGIYEPDFYLPEYDIYLEHFGIDKAGDVAPWFSTSTNEYHAKIRWAREQFEETNAGLIETYEFEHEAGRLRELLRGKLRQHGVDLDRMQLDELAEAAFEYKEREGWVIGKLEEFITNAKRFDLKPDAIDQNLNSDHPRQYHFGRCGCILLQQYQRFLVEEEMIDFPDMIQQTIDHIREDPEKYRSDYDHLLVDEFQDIGKGKVELIQELTGEAGSKLFAVGDDWQSIYSFQGAVVDYFIEFESHFGEPVRTDLTRNFRSPPTVIEAGNELITNNDSQLEKEVTATANYDFTPRVHTVQGYSFQDYVYRVARYATDLTQEYLQKGATPGDIMILCRFDGAVKYLDEIKQRFRKHDIPYRGKSDRYLADDSSEGVSVYSVFQAKGREASHVILLHAVEGPYGFPPSGRENELLEPVKPVKANTVAEERRAFYVAVTRTEKTLDLLTRTDQKSRFLEEVSEFTREVDQSEAIEPLDDVGSEMSVTAKVKQLYEDIHQKKHQDGILVDQYGGSARFISWAGTDPPTLELGDWYRFDGVLVDEFNESKELVVTRRSSVTEVDGPSFGMSTSPRSAEAQEESTERSDQSQERHRRTILEQSRAAGRETPLYERYGDPAYLNFWLAEDQKHTFPETEADRHSSEVSWPPEIAETRGSHEAEEEIPEEVLKNKEPRQPDPQELERRIRRDDERESYYRTQFVEQQEHVWPQPRREFVFENVGSKGEQIQQNAEKIAGWKQQNSDRTEAEIDDE